MTSGGGIYGGGVIYKVKPDGTNYTKLLDFNDTTSGSNPQGSLVISGSTLYGMTSTGGSFGNGEIFKINTDSIGFSKLYSFSGGYDGRSPKGSLAIAGSTLYGMTSGGGNYNNGEIFKINSDGSGYASLYSFDGESAGGDPLGSLSLSDSSMYGMTNSGGKSGYGLIFKIDTNGTYFTDILDFDGGSLGGYPYGSLTVSADTFYGMTYQGGANNNGIVFKVNKDGTKVTNLLNFKDTTNGSFPYGTLAISGKTLFGTTSSGGTYNNGTLFRLSTDGTGFSKIKDFNDTTGITPKGGLTIKNGIIYGVTSGGGPGSGGSIFADSLLLVISRQPINQSVCSETNTGFGVKASGTGLSYQWQVSTDGGTTGIILYLQEPIRFIRTGMRIHCCSGVFKASTADTGTDVQ